MGQGRWGTQAVTTWELLGCLGGGQQGGPVLLDTGDTGREVGLCGKLWLWSRRTWPPILPWPFPCCVTLSVLFTFSEPLP